MIIKQILDSVVRFCSDNPSLTILGTMTLLEIVPIKIDPWSAIAKFIRDKLMGDLEHQLQNLATEFEQEKINTLRWNILSFANSCRNGRMHTQEEWFHCLTQLTEYEIVCKQKHISNGVIDEDSKYLRELYHARCKNNDFL